MALRMRVRMKTRGNEKREEGPSRDDYPPLLSQVCREMAHCR